MEPIKVSVIMSVFNTPERFLRCSIKSILNQSLKNMEFIIINDGSTNNSLDIINEYANSDSRIVVINNEINCGLTKNLNKGLKIARGQYIARMDADDYSMEKRLEIQSTYLDNHSDVGVVGSNGYTNIRGSRAMTYWDNNQIINQINMLFRNAGVPHPTAMFRKVINNEKVNYDEKFMKSQDFALWADLCQKTKIKLLDNFLIIYRIHEGQISSAQSDIQRNCAKQIIADNLRKIFSLDEDVIEKICSLYYFNLVELEEKDLITIVENIINENKKNKVYSQKYLLLLLDEILYEYKFIYKISINGRKLSLKAFILFIKMHYIKRIKYDVTSFCFKIKNKSLIERILYIN